MTTKSQIDRCASVLTKDFLTKHYVEQRKNIRAIASETGINDITISKYLDKFEIPHRTRSQNMGAFVDSSGFEALTTDEHAYWVGFLAADGCVFIDTRKNSAKVQLVLKMSDAEHVRSFQSLLKTPTRVIEGFNGQRDVAKIAVHSHELVQALSKWGVVPNKTLTMEWPNNLPADLIPAYIRGYFDGDGTVYQRHRSAPGTKWTETVCRFISGSVPFLEALANELNKRGVQTLQIYRNQKTNAFFLPVSTRRENLLKFASVIYTGSTVCLERKRVIFQEMEAYHAANPRRGAQLRYQTG